MAYPPPELITDQRLGHAAVRAALGLYQLARVVDGRLVCQASAAEIGAACGMSRAAIENQIRPARGKSGSLVAGGWVRRDEYGLELRGSTKDSPRSKNYGPPVLRGPPPKGPPPGPIRHAPGSKKDSGEGGGMGGVGVHDLSNSATNDEKPTNGDDRPRAGGEAAAARCDGRRPTDRPGAGEERDGPAPGQPWALEAPGPAAGPQRRQGGRSGAREWSCTPAEDRAMRAVLTALHEARAAAGMAVTRKVPAPGVTSVGPHRGAPGFLGRYRELVEAGEDADPTAVLVALVQAKTQEHADHRGNDAKSAKKRAGAYLTSVSLTRDAWWPQNLAAARAWLAGARPTAVAATSTDGSIVPGMEIQL